MTAARCRRVSAPMPSRAHRCGGRRRRQSARASLRARIALRPRLIECRFRFSDLGGTTPKFHCVLESGKELRAKYGPGIRDPRRSGRHPPADRARLRCRHGHAGRTASLSRLSQRTVRDRESRRGDGRAAFIRTCRGSTTRYEDFEWVVDGAEVRGPPDREPISRRAGRSSSSTRSIRRRAARRVRTSTRCGCSRCSSPIGTTRPRISGWCVCRRHGRRARAAREPFLMLQDVGSTFGPRRVDLEAWETSTIWEDRAACKVSMQDLPYGGGTFGPTRISERGRRFLARLLDALDRRAAHRPVRRRQVRQAAQALIATPVRCRSGSACSRNACARSAKDRRVLTRSAGSRPGVASVLIQRSGIDRLAACARSLESATRRPSISISMK